MLCLYNIIWQIKRDEVLTHATTWGNLENIMLSKRSQSQEPRNVLLHLYEMAGVENENRLVVATGWGRGVMGVLLMGICFFLW